MRQKPRRLHTKWRVEEEWMLHRFVCRRHLRMYYFAPSGAVFTELSKQEERWWFGGDWLNRLSARITVRFRTLSTTRDFFAFFSETYLPDVWERQTESLLFWSEPPAFCEFHVKDFILFQLWTWSNYQQKILEKSRNNRKNDELSKFKKGSLISNSNIQVQLESLSPTQDNSELVATSYVSLIETSGIISQFSKCWP